MLTMGGILSNRIPLSVKFSDAFSYALHLHRFQKRKGNNIPYLAHLMAVAALVLEMGGNEDLAIAALLHDAVEDQGGKKTLNEIRTRYGEPVAAIVADCSDAFTFPKPPWEKRKQQYLDHLKIADTPAQMVSLADKIHNARSILLDLRRDGPKTWKKFHGGKTGTLWYYNSLTDIFQQLQTHDYVDELARIVAQINQLAQNDE